MTADSLAIAIAEIRTDLHAVKKNVDALRADTKHHAEKADAESKERSQALAAIGTRLTVVEREVQRASDLPPRMAHAEETNAVQSARQEERDHLLSAIESTQNKAQTRIIKTIQIVAVALAGVVAFTQAFFA